MKVTAQFSFWASVVFAILCIAYAGFGFSSIDASMTDATREASRGYAWFWLFMGGVGIASAAGSWLMLSGKLGPLDGPGED
jgi:hypothetical protein